MVARESGRFREPLRVTEGPERRWDDYDIKVRKAQRYGTYWTEGEMEYVILHPTLSFDEVARDIDRSPGAVRRVRYALRVVAGVIPESPKAPLRAGLRQRAERVLAKLGYDAWSDAERARYLSPGRGRESDKTRKAELLRRGLTGGRRRE
jgi:hypothetical protein